MPRLAWLTDIHLNFVKPPTGIEAFLEGLRRQAPSGVLISGDIGEAPKLIDLLQLIDDCLQLPVYFVLGNHDFYRGSIASMRRKVRMLCKQRPNLKYLTLADEPIALSLNTGLIGHDGWADGRAGDYERSTVMLNDYLVIRELAGLSLPQRKEQLQRLADEAALHLRRLLTDALGQFEQVILMTHVPPFLDLCRHEGEPLDDNWAPHFCSVTLGETIREVMAGFTQRKLTVLCGHLHEAHEHDPLPNVSAAVGGAVYGQPAIVKLIDLPERRITNSG
ncbi:MAG: metallophosphoesterase [Pirellulaceae bacterium]|nr:metallophosphoesterase [Pirellulaceae bacterium]